MIQNVKEWQTTLIGTVGLILTVMVAIGKITAEESIKLAQLSEQILSGLLSVVLIFNAKDSK